MEVHLSDAQRRLICRLAFLLTCLLPTGLVMRAIVFPVSLADQEMSIQEVLGLPVWLDQIRHDTPWQTEWLGLRLQPGPEATWIGIDRVEVSHPASGRLFQAGTISGSPAGFFQAWSRIGQRLAGGTPYQRATQLTADRVVVRQSGSDLQADWELRQVEARVNASGDQWTLEFRCPDGVSPDPVRIRRTAARAQVSWQIECGNNPVPGWVLAGLAPGIAWMAHCDSVSGNALLHWRDGHWTGEFSNLVLSGVDLEQTVGQTCVHRLSGRARIVVDSLLLVDDRIYRMSGQVTSPAGFIGASLMNACQECAGMKLVAPWGGRDTAYRNLALAFRLSDFGVLITAVDSAEAILSGPRGNRILIPAAGQPLPLGNLLALLAWPHHRTAPVNSHTAALAAGLAWPPLPRSGNVDFSAGVVTELPTIGEPLWD